MVKNLLIATVAMLGVATVANAQEGGSSKPFSVAATVSYNNYLNVDAPYGNESWYAIEGQNIGWTDKKLMIGFEGAYNISEELRVVLGGGFNYNYKPGYKEVPGASYSNYKLPGYSTVANKSKLTYTAFVGADYRFSLSQNLKPYAGFRAKGGQCISQMKYDNAESMGKSVAEAWTIGGAFVGGVDYEFNGGLYIGCQFDVLSYNYGVYTIKPQPGLDNYSADTHDFGFLAAPTIKIGFNF